MSYHRQGRTLRKRAFRLYRQSTEAPLMTTLREHTEARITARRQKRGIR